MASFSVLKTRSIVFSNLSDFCFHHHVSSHSDHPMPLSCKGPCDYIELTWVIQDTLFHLKTLSYLQSTLCLERQRIHRFQKLGYVHLWRTIILPSHFPRLFSFDYARFCLTWTSVPDFHKASIGMKDGYECLEWQFTWIKPNYMIPNFFVLAK